ncbi:MAG: flagellar basal body rod C-terminal domain-containing protein [Planctomycetaceae bacterium]
MIRGGFILGVIGLGGSALAASPPVVAPKPIASPAPIASMPVVGCDACRFLSRPPHTGAIVPVDDGPSFAPEDAIPEPLPPAEDATPLPAADADLDLRTLIEQTLPEATADERRVWLDELQGLPPQMARDILSARVSDLSPRMLPESTSRVPAPADVPPEPPLQSEPVVSDTLAPLRTVRRRPESTPLGHATTLAMTLATLRQAEAVHLHNVANAGTPGFKRRQPLTVEANGTDGISGVVLRRVVTQGSLQETGRPFDVAIDGDGYLQVRLGDTVALTRGGSLHLTPEREIAILIDDEAWTLHPPVVVPEEATQLMVSPEGVVGYTLPGHGFVQTGQIQLARMLDPSRLEAAGGGLLAVPESAGPATVGPPGDEGFGSIRQGFREASNVDLAAELRALRRVRRQLEAFDAVALPLLATPSVGVKPQ